MSHCTKLQDLIKDSLLYNIMTTRLRCNRLYRLILEHYRTTLTRLALRSRVPSGTGTQVSIHIVSTRSTILARSTETLVDV